MEKKRKGGRRSKQEKVEVRKRLSESPTGKTVELSIVSEEAKPRAVFPSCLELHKVKRLIV